jgi:glycosyltransferase 2 family protein
MQRHRAILILKLAISAALLAVLYGRMDFANLAAALRRVRPGPLALFLLLLLGNTAVSAWKWKSLLAADGVVLPFAPLFGSYWVGTFFNVFLPSNIGGDAYRIVDVGRRSARPVHTAASVFADRLSGFLALAVFGIGFPLLGRGLLAAQPVLLALPLVTFAGLLGLLWMLWAPAPSRWLLRRRAVRRFPRIETACRTFLESMAAYRGRPRVMGRVMAISFLFQFTVIVAVSLLGAALELRIPFFAYCVFVPLISLLEAVPVSIYGLGLRDTGYVLFLTQTGHTRGEAAALSLLYVSATLLYASVGGMIWAARRAQRETQT